LLGAGTGSVRTDKKRPPTEAASSDDYVAFFFNALRFLVAVLSDLSGCSCVLKEIFSNLSMRS
jgi:hypothetical protein